MKLFRCFAVFIFLLGAVPSGWAQVVPILPALPKATVNVAIPTQGTAICPTLMTGTDCIRNVPAGNFADLQTAVNAATCGDSIVLPAGSVYVGNLKIPALPCTTGWLVIESSAVQPLSVVNQTLPWGVRVSPASVASMATITTPVIASAVQFPIAGIHNVRFIGLEINCAACGPTGQTDLNSGLIEIDGGQPVPSSQAATPNNIIIDRCYIHGTPTQNIRSGVRANGTNIAIIDSYISEIHEAGAASGGDSQAIEDWNGAGPLLIQNNFLEAASENVMFGGAPTSIANLVPSDITITGNYFYKDPSWRFNVAPFNWFIKDALEFKNAQRVLVRGNTFAYCWEQGQAGELIEFTPRALTVNPWATAADITVIGNLLEHAAEGFIIGDSDNNSTPTSQPPQRILIQSNVLKDVNETWAINRSGEGWGFVIGSIPTGTIRTNWHDLTIDHNFIQASGKNAAGILTAGGNGGPSASVPAGPIQVTNNTFALAPGFIGGNPCAVVGNGTACGTKAMAYWKEITWLNNAVTDSLVNYPTGTVSVTAAMGPWWWPSDVH